MTVLGAALLLCGACSANSHNSQTQAVENEKATVAESSSAAAAVFSGDSAFLNVRNLLEFGPRVPNTEAHRKAGDFLYSELKRHGAFVREQKASLKAFDGTILNARNIMGSFNADNPDRVLLLAHWDSRPWADEDPDPQKRSQPVHGANDGASGIGVLLELARQIALNNPERGIDILFVDAEDWGTEGDESSWAMGTRYFVRNPLLNGYSPEYAILLDMVGSPDATFHREYFSQQAAPQLADALWATAHRLGYSEMFPNRLGSAVTDDHVELIKGGIPAIDIIDYRPQSGFPPEWHTTHDTLSAISASTLDAVGKTLQAFLF